MPQFCVNKSAQPSGEHDVHNLNSGCSLLPNFENRIVLGSHSGYEGAMREARKHFSSIDGCPECATECNERLTSEAVNAAIAAAITVSNM